MSARRILLAAAGGGGSFTAGSWHRGTVTPDGSPATVLANGNGNFFPGIVWLDASRVLVVFDRAGVGIGGIIGTVTGSWTFSWGSPFAIYANTSAGCADAVSIVDGQIVVSAILFDAGLNHDPFFIVCNDPPASFTSSSTWGSPIAAHLTSFTAHNLVIGRVQKLQDGTYIVGYYGNNTAANFESGVLLSSSLTDWSARTKVVIGPVNANAWSELDVEEMPDGTVVVLDRAESASPHTHWQATSSDHGATWTSLAVAFQGHGYPAWRRLTSGIRVSVYRRSTSAFGPYWRQSADDGATWSSETLLDGTIVGAASEAAYATFLQLDDTHALCVYAIADNSFAGASNLYSQVFTDSSTFGI